MEPKTIEELRAVKCPHISAEDMIELGEFSGPVQSKSPTKRKHNSKPMLLVIDVRVQEEYPLFLKTKLTEQTSVERT